MSRWESYQRDLSYKIYVTDALQAISENTTHLCGFNGVVDYGRSMSKRWYETIDKPEPEIIDNRPFEEIVDEIFAKMKGVKM